MTTIYIEIVFFYKFLSYDAYVYNGWLLRIRYARVYRLFDLFNFLDFVITFTNFLDFVITFARAQHVLTDLKL